MTSYFNILVPSFYLHHFLNIQHINTGKLQRQRIILSGHFIHTLPEGNLSDWMMTKIIIMVFTNTSQILLQYKYFMVKSVTWKYATINVSLVILNIGAWCNNATYLYKEIKFLHNSKLKFLKKVSKLGTPLITIIDTLISLKAFHSYCYKYLNIWSYVLVSSLLSEWWYHHGYWKHLSNYKQNWGNSDLMVHQWNIKNPYSTI